MSLFLQNFYLPVNNYEEQYMHYFSAIFRQDSISWRNIRSQAAISQMYFEVFALHLNVYN